MKQPEVITTRAAVRIDLPGVVTGSAGIGNGLIGAGADTAGDGYPR